MGNVKFSSGEQIPLEMHKVRVVQKLNLLPVEQRQDALYRAGFNTFLLKNNEVFLDMLTDSGVNAMSDNQLAAMMRADDSYAGSETFYRLEKQLQNVFGMLYFLPAHQGRACENIIAHTLVKQDQITLMNFHFTTTKALITYMGGSVEELVIDEGLKVSSDHPFKGNMNLEKLEARIQELTPEKISFIRLEAGTNLIGGQPISMENIRAVSAISRKHSIPFVLDASLLSDNLYFIKVREPEFRDKPLLEITRELGELCDIIYFSARKLGCARGGAILTNSPRLHEEMRAFIPLFEGFITYGGMSVREMEILAVGLEETLDMEVIEQTPIFIDELAKELEKNGVPVVTPHGGLGCHINASAFVDHIPQAEYPAGALAAAIYLTSGVRAMERGTLSEQRNPDGSEHLSEMELVRLAIPKRVFTLSQIKYVADRISWLYQNRTMIQGLEFTEEPDVLRFFFGRLKETTPWADSLSRKFRDDFNDSL